MTIKHFIDTADLAEMKLFYESKQIHGFTTNPTLIRQAGIKNYLAYAKEASVLFADLPLSLEVLADDLHAMQQQAVTLSRLSNNIYVKIPITNTKGESTAPIVRKLTAAGVMVNITAVFTVEQVAKIIPSLNPAVPAIISVFAGRIANAGVDPMPIITETVSMTQNLPWCETLWASSREAFNVVQAQQCGCHIITLTPSLLKTLTNFGKDLHDYSLETVKMFFNDATQAGYTL